MRVKGTEMKARPKRMTNPLESGMLTVIEWMPLRIALGKLAESITRYMQCIHLCSAKRVPFLQNRINTFLKRLIMKMRAWHSQIKFGKLALCTSWYLGELSPVQQKHWKSDYKKLCCKWHQIALPSSNAVHVTISKTIFAWEYSLSLTLGNKLENK